MNSPYTIFEFNSSEKSWGAKFFPVSLLAISVIVRLVYAIIKTGNPRRKGCDLGTVSGDLLLLEYENLNFKVI
jgi:hypothetical protein